METWKRKPGNNTTERERSNNIYIMVLSFYNLLKIIKT